jgi:hypothetical protein
VTLDTTGVLTREQAVRMYESGWWVGMPARDVAMFQLHEDRLCMPIDVFKGSLDVALGRPVYTHELALNRVGLIRELLGEDRAPTLQEILDLIPAEKRVVVWPDGKIDGKIDGGQL